MREIDYVNGGLNLISEEKDAIIALLRKKGYRITRQRKQILDIVFAHECSSCKEIYYEAIARDSSIGIATVYRMINTLTELGVFQSEVSYKDMCLSFDEENDCYCVAPGSCKLMLDNHRIVELTDAEWQQILGKALALKGISGKVTSILLSPPAGSESYANARA